MTDRQYSNEFVFVSVFFFLLWLHVQVERGSTEVNVMNVTDTIASTGICDIRLQLKLIFELS